MKIGFIDSGKGALAVAEKVVKKGDEAIVIMDECFFPYGNKTKEFLCKRAFFLVNYLINLKVDKIILACNTLSLQALAFLNQAVEFEIIGIFDFIKDELNSRSLVLGSQATYHLVNKLYPGVPTFDASELINAIQRKEDYKTILDSYQSLFKKYDRLILACTHFLYIAEEEFKKEVVDPISKLKDYLYL